MRQQSTTRDIDHPPGIGAPPGPEPDVGRPIDDPSPGGSEPGRREPSAPEVDGPARPLYDPREGPASKPVPAIDPPAPDRLSRFETAL